MDIPQPPSDPEQKKIIDKLAQFVARNGIEFENMTKGKQRENPKFSFLFGGEMYGYYQYKVTTEQIIQKQNEIREAQSNGNGPPMHQGESSWQQNMANPTQSQGEYSGNSQVYSQPSYPQQYPAVHSPFQAPVVTPQYDQYNPPQNTPPPFIPYNAPVQVPAVPPVAPSDPLTQQMQLLTDQITQSEQNLAAQHQVLLQQQTQQTEEAIRCAEMEELAHLSNELGIPIEEFDQILNPIIASCTKDGISHGKQWIFAKAVSERHSMFLSNYLLRRVLTPGVVFNLKLHVIYLLNDVLHHCVRKNVNDLHQCLETVVVPMFASAMLGATQEQKAKLHKLISLWESKANYFSESVLHMLKDAPGSWQNYQNGLLARFTSQVAAVSTSIQMQYENYKAQHETFVQHALQRIQQLQQQVAQVPMIDLTRPPPGFDAAIPPPTDVPAAPSEADLLPAAPYYELPAGIMVPLIGVDKHEYHPLNPDDIRLPPPASPSERLLAAVEAFYAPPANERSRGRNIRLEDAPNRRDRDGWEQLGLYEFFKAKNSARRQREHDIEDGIREDSPPPSPIRSSSSSRSPSPVKVRRYSSVSPERTEVERPPKRRSRSRSRSRTPPRRKSRSPSPRPASRRSPTPPMYSGFGSGAPATSAVTRLDESNKGHQLLKAMGWGGAGLGSKEQGIAEPISGGEVRDRQDKFKGVGVTMHDPFENFRKSKGQAFVTRMKARAEELAAPLEALRAKEEAEKKSDDV